MNTRQYITKAITEIMRAEGRMRCGSRQLAVNAMTEAKSALKHALHILDTKASDDKMDEETAAEETQTETD